MSRRRRRLARLLTRGLKSTGNTPSWVARQLALAGLFGLLASLLVEWFLLPARLALSFPQLWLLFTAGVLVQWTAQPLRGPVSLPPAPATDQPGEGRVDRPYPLADRWERRLSVTSGDPEWYERVVRDRLTELVAERLWQRQGVRLAAEPERARAVLGDELHEFLTAPLAATPGPAELGHLISRMEEI